MLKSYRAPHQPEGKKGFGSFTPAKPENFSESMDNGPKKAESPKQKVAVLLKYRKK